MKNRVFPEYPKPDGIDFGFKVGWRLYKSFEDATKCAEIAAEIREYKLSQGYDFGYCWPGTIEQQSNGLYRVCIP